LDLNVPLYTLVLGGDLQIPTLSGPVKVPVKPETKNGETLRLKGKGMPVYGKKEFGNLYVTLSAELPSGLSAKEKELFSQLQELLPFYSVIHHFLSFAAFLPGFCLFLYFWFCFVLTLINLRRAPFWPLQPL